jgi:hypothetical protein
VVGKGTGLDHDVLGWLQRLAESVNPAQHFYRRLSTGDECFGLLVLSETPTINLGFGRSYSAIADKPNQIPSILSRELLRIPEVNQRGHASTVPVSLL